MEQLNINAEDVEGYEFFKYYFPCVKMLDAAQKLKIGIQIQQALLEELQHNNK